MEVEGYLVGYAYFIYEDDVEMIARSVEELIVNLGKVLLRSIEGGLFLSAHKLVLFCQGSEFLRQFFLGDVRRT